MAWCRQATSRRQQQAITLTNGVSNLCRHMASLGPNELISTVSADLVLWRDSELVITVPADS